MAAPDTLRTGLLLAVEEIEAWAHGRPVDRSKATKGAKTLAELIRLVPLEGDLQHARRLLELLGDGFRFGLDESTSESALRMAKAVRAHLKAAEGVDGVVNPPEPGES